MRFFNFYTPKISDIQFHKDNWELHEGFENDKAWYTEKRDPARIRFFDRQPDWPFDLRDEKAARDFFEAQSRSLNGVLIEIAVENIAGTECLVGVFKYKSPVPNDLGMYYVGIVWMPFEKFLFQINFESMEKGTTGMREAAVAMIVNPAPVKSDEEPVMLNSMEELFANLRKKPVQAVPSDDKKYDEMFAEHPLSKVRALLDHFRNNVKIDKQLLKQKPFRRVSA
ncbi:hypothetical protein ACO0LD_17960 [Undibacterium sp. Ji83W]|uniref:hypothetical protein n=1 Tax=Undibacterium sp. Ji83W TaxID=3413043 RepID=UPI003BF43137